MLQIYSSNLTVDANATYPLNTISLQKGQTVKLSGAASIQLDKCGVYMVTCDAYATITAAGVYTVQMYKNGIPQPQAISSATGAAADVVEVNFTTLVQATSNNTNCCCTAPTVLQFVNGDSAVTDAHINICVTKIC